MHIFSVEETCTERYVPREALGKYCCTWLPQDCYLCVQGTVPTQPCCHVYSDIQGLAYCPSADDAVRAVFFSADMLWSILAYK